MVTRQREGERVGEGEEPKLREPIHQPASDDPGPSDEAQASSTALLVGPASALRCLAQALEDAGPQPHQTSAPARLCQLKHCATCYALQLCHNQKAESFYQAPDETKALLIHSALRLAAFPDWEDKLERNRSLSAGQKASIGAAVKEISLYYREHFNLIGEQALCLVPYAFWKWRGWIPRLDFGATADFVLDLPAVSDEVRYTVALVYGSSGEEEALRAGVGPVMRQWLVKEDAAIAAATHRLQDLAARE